MSFRGRHCSPYCLHLHPHLHRHRHHRYGHAYNTVFTRLMAALVPMMLVLVLLLLLSSGGMNFLSPSCPLSVWAASVRVLKIRKSHAAHPRVPPTMSTMFSGQEGPEFQSTRQPPRDRQKRMQRRLDIERRMPVFSGYPSRSMHQNKAKETGRSSLRRMKNLWFHHEGASFDEPRHTARPAQWRSAYEARFGLHMFRAPSHARHDWFRPLHKKVPLWFSFDPRWHYPISPGYRSIMARHDQPFEAPGSRERYQRELHSLVHVDKPHYPHFDGHTAAAAAHLKHEAAYRHEAPRIVNVYRHQHGSGDKVDILRMKQVHLRHSESGGRISLSERASGPPPSMPAALALKMPRVSASASFRFAETRPQHAIRPTAQQQKAPPASSLSAAVPRKAMAQPRLHVRTIDSEHPPSGLTALQKALWPYTSPAEPASSGRRPTISPATLVGREALAPVGAPKQLRASDAFKEFHFGRPLAEYDHFVPAPRGSVLNKIPREKTTYAPFEHNEGGGNGKGGSEGGSKGVSNKQNVAHSSHVDPYRLVRLAANGVTNLWPEAELPSSQSLAEHRSAELSSAADREAPKAR